MVKDYMMGNVVTYETEDAFFLMGIGGDIDDSMEYYDNDIINEKWLSTPYQKIYIDFWMVPVNYRGKHFNIFKSNK